MFVTIQFGQKTYDEGVPMYPTKSVGNDARYMEARRLQSNGATKKALAVWNSLVGSKATELDLHLEALRQTAVCNRLLGNPRMAESEFLNAIEQAEAHERPLIAALARLDYSALLLEMGKQREAEGEAEKAFLDILEEVQDISHPLVGMALGYLGRAFGRSNDKRVRRRGALLLALADTYLRFCGDPQFRSQLLTNLAWQVETPTIIGYFYLPMTVVEAVRQGNALRLAEVVILGFAGRRTRDKAYALLRRR